MRRHNRGHNFMLFDLIFIISKHAAKLAFIKPMILLFSESNGGFGVWPAGQNFLNSDERTGQQLRRKHFPREGSSDIPARLQLGFRAAASHLRRHRTDAFWGDRADCPTDKDSCRSVTLRSVLAGQPCQAALLENLFPSYLVCSDKEQNPAEMRGEPQLAKPRGFHPSRAGMRGFSSHLHFSLTYRTSVTAG